MNCCSAFRLAPARESKYIEFYLVFWVIKSAAVLLFTHGWPQYAFAIKTTKWMWCVVSGCEKKKKTRKTNKSRFIGRLIWMKHHFLLMLMAFAFTFTCTESGTTFWPCYARNGFYFYDKLLKIPSIYRVLGKKVESIERDLNAHRF